MEIIKSDQLDIFSKPARLLVAGLSGSGKSYFTSGIIRKYRHVFNRVVVVGSELENVSDLNIERNDTFNPLGIHEDDCVGNTLVIFDDIIFQPQIVKVASEIFVRGRHKGISVLFLTQNLYMSDKSFRILSLNASHVALFRIRDVNQIKYFGKSFLNEEEISAFVNLYKKVVLKQSYGYLLVDFTQTFDSAIKLRTSVLNEIEFERAFQL